MSKDEQTPKAIMRYAGGRAIARKQRSDGWTAERRKIFFGHLAATCNVRFSADQAGMSKVGCYVKRRNDPVFAADWDAALADGYVRLETMLIARAGGTDDATALAAEMEADARRAAAAETNTETAESMIALTDSLDSQLALQLMSAHRKVVHGGVHARGGVPAARVEVDALNAKILKQLAALARHDGAAE